MPKQAKSQNNNYQNFRKGQVIVKQGDKGDNAYIIEEGKVEIILTKQDGTDQHLGYRSAGSIIGEMAIVDDAPRTATVKAVEPCKMLVISRENFTSRLNNVDPILQMIMRVILLRYRDTITRAQIFVDPKAFPPPEDLEKKYLHDSEAVESLKMANSLDRAISNNQMELHYQPIMNLQKGKIHGFEALMRWPQEDGSYIPPYIFIPVAEESGLIVRASQWAIKTACGFVNSFPKLKGLPKTAAVAINFSEIDFSHPDFFSYLSNTIKKFDVKPQQLYLEITESILMKQPEVAKNTLTQCRKAGFKVAIDDFGTGYSSLSYLHYFPIDFLKIDRSFVQQMTLEKNSMELIKSIIALGKSIDMKVIAEGVENENEAKILKELNCDMAQGYYFSKPIPEKKVAEFVSGGK